MEELVQSTLYTRMELLQWIPLKLLMYANSKYKIIKKRKDKQDE
jgi:hypothetical protein